VTALPTPFHEDELAAQRLAGSNVHPGAIRDHMPDQHRSFFEGLGFALVGVLDAQGWPVATILSAAPGFLRAPDTRHLKIRSLPPAQDPAAQGIRADSDVAILGIDLATRRRNRANGVILDADAQGFHVHVRQSFGNCPKYIQRRSAECIAREPGAIETWQELPDSARALITGADTFFVASRSRPQICELGRVDVSHRGGVPGFVTIDAHDDIVVPDYPGNRYFNTLGNLLGDARAALLFIDFERGDVLQLQGRVRIDWSGGGEEGKPAPSAANRSWRFRTQRAWRRRAALALRWKFVDYSPESLAMAPAATCATFRPTSAR
jgi:predicted pyridoxine 5'-phosphate oxidase superfamily flavin-nucleotide-binding protein